MKLPRHSWVRPQLILFPCLIMFCFGLVKRITLDKVVSPQWRGYAACPGRSSKNSVAPSPAGKPKLLRDSGPPVMARVSGVSMIPANSLLSNWSTRCGSSFRGAF